MIVLKVIYVFGLLSIQKIAERKRSALCIPRIKFDGEVLYLELDCHRNNESFGAVRLQKV